MFGLKLSAIIVSLVLVGAVLVPAARADEWDQMTKLSFSQPVEIPGQVLPAGTYWFVLASSSSDRNLVQIFSADWRTVYATLITIPTYRQEVTGRTEIKFAERPHDRPEAVYKWYYPGLMTGHEFLYRKRVEKELVRDAKLDILARPIPS